jgi:acetyl-CoA carboxylase biotin carboxyl carrier protein
MDLKELKALLRLMEGADIEELEVEEGGRRVRIRRRTAPPPLAHAPAPAAAAPRPAPAAEESGLLPILAPMVGTFYRAPAPGADPYVKEGDLVQKGQVVCILEAMKLMNEIEAEAKGKVARILVENGQPVEFGQTLFLLAPA